MKIVIDTNVLVSAALRDRLPERVVLFVATDDACRWLVTSNILAEYYDVLKRPKFRVSDEIWKNWKSLIDLRTTLIAIPSVDVQLPRDPKDTPFLACALAASADYLITGDNDLLTANLPLPTRIVTVAQFAAEIRLS